MNRPTKTYRQSLQRRLAILVALALLLPVALAVSIAVGAASVPLTEIGTILCGGQAETRHVRIVFDIRLPQALAALVAGAGLAVSGATMQGVLRNPLTSPFTLGISGAAAFGAALMLFLGGGNIVNMDNTFSGSGFSSGAIAFGAFLWAMLATVAVLIFGRLRGSRGETIILIGVALNSLFSAGLMFLQYLSDDTRLAAIVFWTFGDTARVTWNGLGLMLVFVAPISVYFLSQSWNYNALAFGEETAMGLGVPVRRLRLLTMLLASLLTAVLVALLGIIGFVGLVVPHIVRLFVGSDHRFLLPCSLVFGALLLLVADTSARLILAPRVLPVSVLTAFIGVPVFLMLLINRRDS